MHSAHLPCAHSLPLPLCFPSAPPAAWVGGTGSFARGVNRALGTTGPTGGLSWLSAYTHAFGSKVCV